MNHPLRTLATWSMLAVLLSTAGCQAKEMPDARRDYLLAHDHGWIDLTVKAPTGAPGFKAGEACQVALLVNGETLLLESANLAEADGAGIPVGYRFVAPAGKLQAELHIGACVKEALVVKVPLQLDKDHLLALAFDGAAAKAGAATAFEPASLEWVRAEMLRMQANGRANDAATDKLTRLAIYSAVLNAIGVLALLGFTLRRRSR
ncbi:hypothetical protein [Massilia pseudoviolaceinigra]|uniref:hypothetical protein n=1 Tax=Massilia pseudoviolaceinigra TaxID=3057165 RepID=UPI002796B3A8|nr:hypothetical protein [Massilia sp. CCM 9206]MDQ1920614.1 hypothetical protein [Massilia sp. CCM 9206]